MDASRLMGNVREEEMNCGFEEAGEVSNLEDYLDVNGEKSLVIVRKKKLINKKVLRSIIKNQAISPRYKANTPHESSNKNQTWRSSNPSHPAQPLKNQNFINFIQNQVDNVTCPICISELIQPVSTHCSHLFCLQCIEKSLLNGNSCPLCRQTIADEDNFGLIFDRQAQKLVRKLNSYSTNEEQEAHYKAYFQWKNSRFLSEQQITLQANVDVWMPQGSWYTGQIKQIYRHEDNTLQSLLIQIQMNAKTIKEIIQYGSFRLAKPYFYNKKKEKFDIFRIGLRELRSNSTSLENLLDRTRNLFTTQVFQLRSRIFFGEGRPNLEQRVQREVEEIGPIPFMHHVESQILSGGQGFSDGERNEESAELANLQPVAAVQNPEFQTIHLQRLNPQNFYSFQLPDNLSQFEQEHSS